MVLGGFEWFWVVLGGFGGRDDPKNPKNSKEHCLEIYFRIYIYIYIYYMQIHISIHNNLHIRI